MLKYTGTCICCTFINFCFTTCICRLNAVLHFRTLICTHFHFQQPGCHTFYYSFFFLFFFFVANKSHARVKPYILCGILSHLRLVVFA